MKTYKGQFNWHGQTYEFYTTAMTENSALLNLRQRLTKAVGFRVPMSFMYSASADVQEVQTG